MSFFDDIARRMAEWNVAPEAILPILSQHLGSLAQPIATNESFPGARQAISEFNQNPQIPGFGGQATPTGSMQGVARSPGPAQPPEGQQFSFGGLLKDLLNPMPTNESFPQGRELWNRPIMPGVAPGGPPPAPQPMAPMQGPPMEAAVFPQSEIEQGPPLGAMMNPTASTFPARPEGQPTGKMVGKPFDDFMETVRSGGLTNPYGLAAVAATGTRESGWNQSRIAGTWSDKSQTGAPGTSGGALSWRNERYRNMIEFAERNGLDPHQSSTQAQFFMQEDPNLIQKLNSASSAQEAQSLMNNAWAFAGFNDPNHHETKARFQKAEDFSGAFAGGVGNWTEAMNKAGVKTSESGNVSTPVETKTTPTTTTGSPVVAPASSQPMTFGQRLGEMAKGIKAPESKKAPSGQAPAPQTGNYRPDPQQLQMIMAMLGAGGSPGVGQVAPTLTDLLNPGGRRR